MVLAIGRSATVVGVLVVRDAFVPGARVGGVLRVTGPWLTFADVPLRRP